MFIGRQFWLALLCEAVVWLLIPMLFLSVYIFYFGADWSVVGAHIFIVISFWMVFFAIRVVLWRALAKAKLLAAFLWGMPVILFFMWYVVVLLGLFSWGRVPTLPLLSIYISQGGALLEVLGISFWFLVPYLVLVLLCVVACYRYVYTIDWSRQVSGRLSLSGLSVMAVLVVLVFAGQLFRLFDLTELHPQEPIGVSLFGKSSGLLQSHAFAVSPLIDAAEEQMYSNYTAAEDFSPRNVILIVGDALRLDHMSIYGYPRATTPYLDASRGKYQTLLASPVRSVCAESSCGLAAIASSRPLHLFPNKPFTLHEVLRRHNYEINLILSGDHTNFYGLRESYGAVDSYFDGTLQKKRYVNDDLLVLEYVAELPEYDGVRPAMFQFHLMSSHGLGRRHTEVFEPSINYYKWAPGKEGVVAPDEEGKFGGINYYDNGVVQFDYVVERILGALERKGYLDDAVIVITGDHGERLGENGGYFGHQYNVDEGVLTIPFIVQRRGYMGEGFKEWPVSSQIDVAPTILAELGIDTPSVWLGRALQSSVVERKLYFQQARKVGIYTSVMPQGLLKYWRDLDSGQEFIYTVGDGKGEKEIGVGEIEAGILGQWRAAVTESAVIKVD